MQFGRGWLVRSVGCTDYLMAHCLALGQRVCGFRSDASTPKVSRVIINRNLFCLQETGQLDLKSLFIRSEFLLYSSIRILKI